MSALAAATLLMAGMGQARMNMIQPTPRTDFMEQLREIVKVDPVTNQAVF